MGVFTTSRSRALSGVRLVVVGGLTALGFGIAPAAHADGDDYPYKWTGECKVVDLNAQVPLAPGQEPLPLKLGCEKRLWYVNGSYGDPWGFALRNCTSFVAWRLRTTNGLYDFTNTSRGWLWGNANHWDETARVLGYRVDDIPAVGAVAQSDRGAVGHVAWVKEVHGDGTITIEEYNSVVAGGYSIQRVPASEFEYLHLADLAPGPEATNNTGKVTALDQSGEKWTAKVDEDGRLAVKGPHGRTRLGKTDAWSPKAAPAITVDAEDRVRVAAVARDGRLQVAYTDASDGTWSSPRTLGEDFATGASPSIVTTGNDWVRVIAVTAEGDLTEFHSSGRTWSKAERLGDAGTYSAYASPAVHTDLAGRTWVAAVTRTGSLMWATTGFSGETFTQMAFADLESWEPFTSPRLTGDAKGRTWLIATTALGKVTARHTTNGVGAWSKAKQVTPKRVRKLTQRPE